MRHWTLIEQTEMTMSDDWEAAGEERERSDDEEDCPTKKRRQNGDDEHGDDDGDRRHERQHQIVHSGHFMRSNIHEDTSDDEESMATEHPLKPSPSPTLDRMAMGDLKVLLQNISRAYSTRFTSPSWTDFKGVHLPGKDKARMNNLIWRAWHLEFICGHRPMLCKFTCPLDDPVHRRPQAVVLEGKYWRRKLDAVTEEYKRWRIYWLTARRRRHHEEHDHDDDEEPDERPSMQELLDKVGRRQAAASTQVSYSAVPSPRRNDDAATGDTAIPLPQIDVDATFLSSLFQYPPQPVARCQGQRLNADVIQPGLIPLQPSVDDTSALDLLEILLASYRGDASALGEPVAAATALPTRLPVKAEACEPLPLESSSSSGRSSPSQACGDRTAGVNALTGFDALERLLPAEYDGPVRRATKAGVLQRAADHCRQLQQGNAQLDDRASLLRRQIDYLNRDVAALQAELPGASAPARPAFAALRLEMFDAWVRARASRNCKFALLALLVAPLHESFMSTVSVANGHELRRTLLDWQQQRCSLSSMRQFVLSALTLLSRSTSILELPETLPDELRTLVRSSALVDARLTAQ